MLKIAVCDDEQVYADRVYSAIRNYSYDIEVGVYTDSEALLNDVESREKYFDIYILDIETPVVDGIGTAKRIRSLYDDAVIIFLTNHDKYVFDAFKVEAFRYIIKSETEKEIPEALGSAQLKINKRGEDKYVVFGKHSFDKVRLNSIMYAEKVKKYVEFHLTDGSVMRERATLSEVAEKLDTGNFVIIKKGIIVNIEHVRHFDKNEITMDDGVVLYMGREHIADVKKQMLEYWG